MKLASPKSHRIADGAYASDAHSDGTDSGAEATPAASAEAIALLKQHIQVRMLLFVWGYDLEDSGISLPGHGQSMCQGSSTVVQKMKYSLFPVCIIAFSLKCAIKFAGAGARQRRKQGADHAAATGDHNSARIICWAAAGGGSARGKPSSQYRTSSKMVTSSCHDDLSEA